MDGFKATARIRKLERQIGEQQSGDAEAAAPHIPILALTASATTEYQQKCARQGMDDFLSKVRTCPVSCPLLDLTLLPSDLVWWYDSR
jgi:CheY-like chemotaxis protein